MLVKIKISEAKHLFVHKYYSCHYLRERFCDEWEHEVISRAKEIIFPLAANMLLEDVLVPFYECLMWKVFAEIHWSSETAKLLFSSFVPSIFRDKKRKTKLELLIVIHNDSKTSDKSLIFLNLFISFLLTFICIIFFFMFRSRPGSDIIFHKLLVEREFGIPALAKSLVSFIWSIKCITLSYYMDGAVRELCHGLNYFK